MTPFERIMAIRTGGVTERCHTVRHNGSYSVAAHSWGVAVLLFVLWPEDFARLSPYCIFHDVPEAWVGDIPAPTKRYCSEIKEACEAMESAIFGRLQLPNDSMLRGEDQLKLKACDHLELYLWAREQVTAGNQHADCVRRELERYFVETPLLPEAQAFYLEAVRSSVEHATDGLIKTLNED